MSRYAVAPIAPALSTARGVLVLAIGSMLALGLGAGPAGASTHRSAHGSHHSTASAQLRITPGLKPFLRQWEGHDRGLSINRHGVGYESYSSGCCPPISRYTFQLSNYRRTPAGNPAARLTITAVHIDKGGYRFPGVHVGSYAVVVIRNHIFRERLTGNTFCDNVAASHSACGA